MARSAQSARVAPSAEAAAAYIREIEQFLYREAACLDDRNRWQEWLDLFTDDATYWIPYSKDHKDPLEHASIIYEDGVMRAVRIGKLLHPKSWSQQPASRTARVVGNVQIAGPEPERGDLAVLSTFNMLEFRRDRYQAYGGTYRHHLRRVGDQWKIAHKRVDLISADGIYESIIQVPI